MANNSIRIAVFLLLIAAIIIPLSAFAQEDSVTFPPDSKPYQRSYAEWTAEWWKWFLSIPIGDNPINDPSGERCALGQQGTVWFLIGSGGGKAERECTIPAGRAILMPAINVECSYAEDPSLRTEDDLRACATGDQDLVTETAATLNGSVLQVHRVQSPPFNLTVPTDPVYPFPEGPTRAVSEGFWVFIKPLPPGQYVLHVQGLLVDPTVTAPVNLVEDSTYHLTVENPEFETVQETVTIANGSLEFPVSSTSNVSNVAFDELAKQLSFSISGDVEGSTTMPISWLLEGPLTVVMDGNEFTDYETSANQETGETNVVIIHPPGAHDFVITGTNIVP